MQISAEKWQKKLGWDANSPGQHLRHPKPSQQLRRKGRARSREPRRRRRKHPLHRSLFQRHPSPGVAGGRKSSYELKPSRLATRLHSADGDALPYSRTSKAVVLGEIVRGEILSTQKKQGPVHPGLTFSLIARNIARRRGSRNKKRDPIANGRWTRRQRLPFEPPQNRVLIVQCLARKRSPGQTLSVAPRSGIIGGEHPRIAKSIVHLAQIGRADCDVGYRIVDRRAMVHDSLHLEPSRSHHLHRARCASTTADRRSVTAGAITALDRHDTCDPTSRHIESFGIGLDRRPDKGVFGIWKSARRQQPARHPEWRNHSATAPPRKASVGSGPM